MKDNQLFPLPLFLKGERNYLQGADISAALVYMAGFVRNVTIQIHHMSSHILMAKYSTEAEIARLRSDNQLCAIMVYQDGTGERKLLAVTKDISRVVTQVLPYNESLVIDGCVISEQKVEQDVPGTGNFFERVVALNKYLLNNIVEKHPWVFSRIDLDHAPIETKKIAVLLKQQIGGHTYKSLIHTDDGAVGKIYFTRRSQ